MSRLRSFNADRRLSFAMFATFALFIARYVHADGAVTVSPSSITQNAVLNGQPIVVTITVTNSTSSGFNTPVAQGNTSCTELQSAAWLTLSTDDVGVGSSMSQTFTATLFPAGLAVGSYSATICMLPAPIPVAFTVTPKPPTSPDSVYLHECENDCSVHPGNDNAITGTSSIVTQSVSLAAFPFSDTIFNQVAACTRSALTPFNIHVITNNPGAIARREIMMSTTSSQAGFGSGVPYVVPFSYPILQDNVIGFVFANETGSSVDDMCWLTAAAIGSLYNAEPVLGCPDIMGESIGCGEKSFDNASFTCDGTEFGEPGKCVTGQSTQNSFQLINAGAGTTDAISTNSFEAFEVPSAGPSP